MSAWLARLTSPIVWRLPGHDARMLFGFAQAEAASFLDLRMAAARTGSTARGALYLRHALDEARHAQMFTRASAELRVRRGREPFGVARADASDLHERLGEVGFLAFVHRGERRGRMQFEAYRDWFAARGATSASDEKLRAMFDAILVDERRHETYTRELLLEAAGDERAARKALRRAALWEAWRTWRAMGRFVAKLLFTIAMTLLYFTLAPFALLVRVVRPSPKGWSTSPASERAALPPRAVQAPSSAGE